MIQRLSHSSIYVLDQDEAKAFYTEKLGFEVRNDARLGGFRWLTVSPKGQTNFELVLMPLGPSPMMSEATAEALRGLVAAGTFGGGVLETADCRKTYAELKAKGVEFLGEPEERPYGIEAVLRDNSGNWFSMTQRRLAPPAPAARRRAVVERHVAFCGGGAGPGGLMRVPVGARVPYEPPGEHGHAEREGEAEGQYEPIDFVWVHGGTSGACGRPSWARSAGGLVDML